MFYLHVRFLFLFLFCFVRGFFFFFLVPSICRPIIYYENLLKCFFFPLQALLYLDSLPEKKNILIFSSDNVTSITFAKVQCFSEEYDHFKFYQLLWQFCKNAKLYLLFRYVVYFFIKMFYLLFVSFQEDKNDKVQLFQII